MAQEVISGMMKTTGGLSTGASILGLLNHVSLQAFDVPVTVLGMAAGGTLLSFAHFDDMLKANKKNLIFLAITNWATTVGLVSVLPDVMGLTWLTEKLEAPTALLVAIGMPIMFPVFKKFIPELFQKWFGIGDYSKAKQLKAEQTEGLESYEETDPQPAPTRRKRK